MDKSSVSTTMRSSNKADRGLVASQMGTAFDIL